MKYVVVVNLMVCVLQLFGLSQFFELLFKNSSHLNSIVVGFIGNGTHLSGFLASSIPLFLIEGKREDWLCLTLLLIILFFTGTTFGDPSISGFVVSYLIFLNFYKTKKIKWLLLCLPILILLFQKGNLFAFSGRIELWITFWKKFHILPITGQGLGAVDFFARNSNIKFHHLHQEFFQVLFELGVIGFVLVVNVIKSFFEKTAQTRTQVAVKSCVLGFLVSCCFNYPAHLWVPATWAMFFYAAFEILNKEEISCLAEKK